MDDPSLLRAWATRRDERAFATLLDRHGPLMLAVCRRVLGGGRAPVEAVAEAFQRAAVVLSTKAGSLRDPGGLAPWLHGVALRCARRVDDEERRARRHAPLPADPRAQEEPPMADDDHAALDEELYRLPAPCREALVRCHLEGRTVRDAAELLRCSKSEVARRVERGLELLRVALERRGVTAPVLALLASAHEHAPPVPPALARDALIRAHGAPVTSAAMGASFASLAAAAVALALSATLAVACANARASSGTATTVPPAAEAQRSVAATDERPWSRLDGRTVTVIPLGWSFDIPAQWLEFYSDPRVDHNLRMSRAQLDAEPEYEEWISQFDEFARAALPDARVAFIGNSHGHGGGMRVYVLRDGDPAATLAELEPAASAALGRVESPRERALRDEADEKPRSKNPEEEQRRIAALAAAGAPVTPLARDERDGWQRRSFAMPLHFGDYGGDAWVELRARRIGGALVVIAVLLDSDPATSDPDWLSATLRSFRAAQAPTSRG